MDLIKHFILISPPIFLWRSPHNLRTTNKLVVKRIRKINKKNQISQETQSKPQNQGGGNSEHHWKIKFPYKICHNEHLTDEFPLMDEVHRILAQLQSTQQLVVLNHQFLAQPPPPLQVGNEGPFFIPINSSSIFMSKEYIHVTMWAKSYDVLELSSSPKDSPTPLTSIGPLILDKPVEPVYHPPPQGCRL